MTSPKRVRKAVIPVAGLGTRFLPITKAVPKEMLPLVDVPAVHVIVEECVQSGIEEIIFVTSRGKDSIVDYFDRATDLEALLERRNKTADLDLVRKISQMATVVAVRQAEARGLGHAVLCARAAVGDEPFAVLLSDDLVVNPQRPGVKQLLDVYEATGIGAIALLEVPSGQEQMYGVVAGERVADRTWKLSKLVEKPAPGTAPSRMAVIGRYVLPPDIFEMLANVKPGRGGEIQLTDGLAELARTQGLFGWEIEGKRFDAGDRTGYVLAQVYWALQRADIGADVRVGLERLLSGG